MRVALMVAAGGAACVGAGSALRAQETVTFDVRFDHAVLAPGQVQTIGVWASFEPGVGSVVPWNTAGGTGQPGIVRGFAAGWLDLVNLGGLDSGEFSNLQLAPPLLGVLGEPQPGGGVTGILAFQFLAPSSQANPIRLWTAQWTPLHYAPRTIEVSTLATQPPRIFLDIGLSLPVPDLWKPINPPSTFQVIPAPASAAPLLLLLLAPRRRRASGVKEKT